MTHKISLAINGQPYSGEVEPRLLLIHYLRDVAGLGSHAFRAHNAEALLECGAGIDAPAAVVGEGIDVNSDLYASAEYRLHLARVHAARALRTALSRAE